jgi:hypothetical protein
MRLIPEQDLDGAAGDCVQVVREAAVQGAQAVEDSVARQRKCRVELDRVAIHVTQSTKIFASLEIYAKVSKLGVREQVDSVSIGVDEQAIGLKREPQRRPRCLLGRT